MAEDLWEQKSNDEVVAAYLHLDHYPAESQAVIKAELTRRGLKPSGPDEDDDPILTDSESFSFDNRFPLARLWLGGYPLRIAFWGWLCFGEVAFVAIFAVSSGLMFLFFSFANIIYTGVALVGVWRSAQRYEGPRQWATLAQVVVMLLVLAFLTQLVQGFFHMP
jgi:hypothetical protein